MTMEYQAFQENKYTPTGFSVQGLRDLGDFPDYTVLSGMPMSQSHNMNSMSIKLSPDHTDHSDGLIIRPCVCLPLTEGIK